VPWSQTLLIEDGFRSRFAVYGLRCSFAPSSFVQKLNCVLLARPACGLKAGMYSSVSTFRVVPMLSRAGFGMLVSCGPTMWMMKDFHSFEM
jgi:hypothetical protein